MLLYPFSLYTFILLLLKSFPAASNTMESTIDSNDEAEASSSAGTPSPISSTPETEKPNIPRSLEQNTLDTSQKKEQVVNWFKMSMEQRQQMRQIASFSVSIQTNLLSKGQPCNPEVEKHWLKPPKSIVEFLDADSWKGSLCNFFKYLECKRKPETTTRDNSSFAENITGDFLCDCAANTTYNINIIWEENFKKCSTVLHEKCDIIFLPPNVWPGGDFRIPNKLQCIRTHDNYTQVYCSDGNKMVRRCSNGTKLRIQIEQHRYHLADEDSSVPQLYSYLFLAILLIPLIL